ncbi:oxygenase MpaB family protein [Spongiactinospora sp. TRM90649]|uniref:oxygenase MpaB family protein n=1 Tax=Spongiactinospora sp. TRM90649 TaxID=3031114 RepID=UPI0023F81235|nr:oxygenase MpaB family protein [Spongiactinospora sp. TRM90649]MDF5756454.1 oxygenase MpaB family protein [Spongiactinospora sp. TRM90649]
MAAPHPRQSTPPPEPFGPGSLLWEGMGDVRLMFLLGGALIMQVMHPAVGAAVGERSVYRDDPWGRLTRSLTSLQKWVYGGPAALEEGRRLRELHRGFSGTDERGRRYHALSAEPYAWVHLTAFERSVTAARYFGEPVDGERQRRMYDEILRLGRILQVPERMLPPTVEDYWRYFEDMVAGTLEDHPTAHDVLDVARGVGPPPMLPAVFAPLWRPLGLTSGRVNQFVTIGTLPPAVRAKLGLDWSARDERRLRALGRAVAALAPRLPERIRYLPIAYHARRAARSRARLEQALRAA